MAVLKRLTGAVTITVEGKQKQILDYGVLPQQAGFNAVAARSHVFDVGAATSVEVVSQPTNGRAVARSSDNLISFTLAGRRDNRDETDTSFTYTVDGGPVQTAEIAVEPNERKQGGWMIPENYFPEVDPATDAMIVEPHENVRLIYISHNGLSLDDIAARHAGSGDRLDVGVGNGATINPADLYDRSFARDGSGNGSTTPGVEIAGTYYGETEALALDWEAANLTHRGLANDNQDAEGRQFFMLFERGGTYRDVLGGNSFTSSKKMSGYSFSPLYPRLIGAWGTGADPVIESEEGHLVGTSKWEITQSSANVVVQNLRCLSVNWEVNGSDNVLFDNCEINYGKIVCPGTNGQVSTANGLHNMRFLDCVKFKPSGANWGVNNQNNISEAFYGANGFGFRGENIFSSGAGWGYSQGYRPDGDYQISGAGKPPETFSHTMYFGTKNAACFLSNIMFLHGGHSTAQFRAGGIMDNVFTMAHNTGFNPSNGGFDDETQGGRGSMAGMWTLGHRYVQTIAGGKDHRRTGLTDTPFGGGIKNQAPMTSLIDCLVTNDGAPESTTYTAGNVVVDMDIAGGGAGRTVGLDGTNRGAYGGSQSFGFTNANGGIATLDRDDYAVNNWNRARLADDRSMDGSTPSAGEMTTRDAQTIESWLDGELSVTGSTQVSFDTWARGLPKPWERLGDVIDYMLTPYGAAHTDRTAAQTVTFQPDAGGGTPGQIASLAVDWNTKDRPGTVAGDSIDLDGHRVFWDYTPKNPVNDLTFGKGGELHLKSNGLRPSSINVHADGNYMYQDRGGRFEFPAHSSPNLLTLENDNARTETSAAVTGAVDYKGYGLGQLVMYDNGAWTVGAGRRLDISGRFECCFDGLAGMPTLTVAGTLSFKRGMWLRIDNGTIYDGNFTSKNVTDSMGRPREGDYIEGATSGATARVSYVINSSSKSRMYVQLDDITGQFTAAETLHGPTWFAGCWYVGDSRLGLGSAGGDADLAALGTISATTAPAYSLPKIREVRTGKNGLTAPSVTSTVVLEAGSVIEVDATGMASGTYDLIDVDSLTDNGATLPAGVSVVGNKLVLTV